MTDSKCERCGKFSNGATLCNACQIKAFTRDKPKPKKKKSIPKRVLDFFIEGFGLASKPYGGFKTGNGIYTLPPGQKLQSATIVGGSGSDEKRTEYVFDRGEWRMKK